MTTTNATDLLVGANIVETGTNGPGAGFTQRLNTPDGDIAEDRVVTAAGSYSASAPLSPGGWVMQMVALAKSGGEAGRYHTNRHGIRSNQCDGHHRYAEWVHIIQW